MSVSFAHLEPPSETSYLRDRVIRLRGALDWAGDALPPRLRARVTETVDRVEERLRLGVDSTIVALAGGTGSGKSSLFNALTRNEFAVAGVSRPTTAQPSAATWGVRADPLLDWLGVAKDRRLLVNVAPEGEPDSGFRGMVLLDLPDHDSVDTAHREIVDRLVPMADLIVWVVDPQKYADNALHSRYLVDVAASGAPSAVVLNQIDRLTRADGDRVMFDIRRLLAEKGIANAPVLLTSVTTGAGVDSLRSVLASAVKKRSVAAEAVRAELVAAGRSLAEALSKDAEPVLPSVDGFAAEVAKAAGVDAMADLADSAAASGSAAKPAPAKLTAAAVDAARARWLDAACAGLPAPWRTVLNSAIARPRLIAEAVTVALAAVDWPEVTPSKGMFRRKRGPAVGAQILARGRETVRAAIQATVVDPTASIHRAYVALDELTDLAATEPEEPPEA